MMYLSKSPNIGKARFQKMVPVMASSLAAHRFNQDHKSRQQGRLRKISFNLVRRPAIMPDAFPAQLRNLFDQFARFAMPDASSRMARLQSRENFRDMARLLPHVNHRRAHGQDVRNFARMHQPQHGVAHHDHLRVCRRQRGGQFVQRLIWQAENLIRCQTLPNPVCKAWAFTGPTPFSRPTGMRVATQFPWWAIRQEPFCCVKILTDNRSL